MPSSVSLSVSPLRKLTENVEQITRLPKRMNKPTDYNLPKLDIKTAQLNWSEPSKRIYNSHDVSSFHKSVAIDRIKSTLFLICEKVSLTNLPDGILDDNLVAWTEPSSNSTSPIIPKPNASNILDLPPPQTDFTHDSLSEGVKGVLQLLGSMVELMKETPPYLGPRRYGNLACREWHDKVDGSIEQLLKNDFEKLFECDSGDQFGGFVKEIKYYFTGSFGSRERLDYGTGHELSFLAFISSLLMCNILKIEELAGIDYLIMFGKYYDVVKRLILTYTLEPAGSHGVWGLDDHFHLIYILGSAQLVDFKKVQQDDSEKSIDVLNHRIGMTPSSVMNPTVLKKYRTKNLYFNAIAFIRKVKTGYFNEHSPLLYDISTTKPWEKICKGMIKMYYGEVLSKFPVVQHFYFGNILFPWKDMDTLKPFPESAPESEPEIGSADNLNSEYRHSEAEISMNHIYHRREEELARLIDQKRHVPKSTNKLDFKHSASGASRISPPTSVPWSASPTTSRKASPNLGGNSRSGAAPVVTKAPWAK